MLDQLAHEVLQEILGHLSPRDLHKSMLTVNRNISHVVLELLWKTVTLERDHQMGRIQCMWDKQPTTSGLGLDEAALASGGGGSNGGGNNGGAAVKQYRGGGRLICGRGLISDHGVVVTTSRPIPCDTMKHDEKGRRHLYRHSVRSLCFRLSQLFSVDARDQLVKLVHSLPVGSLQKLCLEMVDVRCSVVFSDPFFQSLSLAPW